MAKVKSNVIPIGKNKPLSLNFLKKTKREKKVLSYPKPSGCGLKIADISKEAEPYGLLEQSLPKRYKGYSTERLLKIWAELKEPDGTKASQEEIQVMDEFLKDYKLGIYGRHRKK